MEILLANPAPPNENLGPRDNDAHSFIIEVGERLGIGSSRFGAPPVSPESRRIRPKVRYLRYPPG